MLSTYLYLANVRILLGLNHALASNSDLYQFAVVATDQLADVLVFATILFLWFWPERREDPIMFASYKPSTANDAQARQEERRRMARHQAAILRLTRQESRAQLSAFGAAGMGAYVTARLLAMGFHVDRPIATYLPLREGVDGAFEGLRFFYAFPSDHAALLGALPLALYYWNRGLGLIWTLLGAVLIVTRVAVGFHYPADMLAGALIGMAFAGVAMQVYRQRGRLYDGANEAAAIFNRDNIPYCYYAYFAMIMLSLEFAMHFKHVFGMITELTYRLHH